MIPIGCGVVVTSKMNRKPDSFMLIVLDTTILLAVSMVLVLNSVRELRLLGPKNSELSSLSMNHSKMPQRVPLNVK